MKTFLPLLSTSFIAISAILVAIGWILIAKRKIEAHKKLMIWAAVFAVLFFIFYLSRTLLLGSTPFAGPGNLKIIYLVFLLFHIILALVGAIMGLLTLYWGFKNQLARHRKIGPWTSVTWFCTAITGVTVYYLLYVKYPGGDVKPLLEAIFG